MDIYPRVLSAGPGYNRGTARSGIYIEELLYTCNQWARTYSLLGQSVTHERIYNIFNGRIPRLTVIYYIFYITFCYIVQFFRLQNSHYRFVTQSNADPFVSESDLHRLAVKFTFFASRLIAFSFA